MSLVIGLTGPTGAGKSTVSAVAGEYGFRVIDCDLAARAACEKGTDGLVALVDAFGKEILNEDGCLNRSALARAAFCSREGTELLNKTFLPYVIKEVWRRAESCERLLLDAPTLFESGLKGECTATIAVLAKREARLQRIMLRDGLSEDEALLRMNAGKSDDFYKENADYIIYNNGEIPTFRKEFETIIANFIKIS